MLACISVREERLYKICSEINNAQNQQQHEAVHFGLSCRRPGGHHGLMVRVSLKEDMAQRKVCQVIKKKKICLSKHDISFLNQRKRDRMVRMGGNTDCVLKKT